MAVGLSAVGNDIAPVCINNGSALVPASGAKLFIYSAGSTTKATSYSDSGGSSQNANPVVLNSAGYPASAGNRVEIWLPTGSSYKFILAPSTDTDPPTSPFWTMDNVPVMNDTSSSQNEWVVGPTPTFVSSTQFTLVGDQTGTFTKSRRIKASVTAGTVYGTITNTAFTTLTTVTVALDSGASLDSGLSAVSYGLTGSVNPSIDADMIDRKGSAVASASTTDIWSIAGNTVHVTGNTGPITSFGTAPYAGARRTVIFDSNPTITHNSTSLQIPGQQSITVVAGTRAIILADTTSNMIIVDLIPPGGTGVPRSYISGLTLSTAGSSATMSIAAGQATDSTNAVVMNLTSAISKTTSAWAVGTGNGGLDTGSIANSTWYKFYEIMRPDTGVVDVIFTTAALATGPAMPTGYSYFRYIGSGKTDGSAHWTSFVQDGDLFQWNAAVLDVNTTNPGTSAISATLTVPTGVNVSAIFNSAVTIVGTASFVYFSDLATSDQAASITAAPLAQVGINSGAGTTTGTATIRTNTSAQIRYRSSGSDANVVVKISTIAWIDTRGRNG